MTVRSARPGEGALVARLIQRHLPAGLRGKTIWDSPKIACYVEDQLRGDRPFPGYTPQQERAGPAYYLLLRDMREPVGVVEYRALAGCAFLNHLYVAEAHQGQGLGSRLLSASTRDYLRQGAFSRVMLDVERCNRRVRRWYGRLGFRQVGETLWQVGPTQASGEPGMIRARAEGEAVERRYGFSRFAIETARGLYWAGRPNANYFRLGGAAWDDPAVRAALHREDSRRLVLLRGEKRAADLETVHHGVRLAAEAARLLQCLESRHQVYATR